MVKKTTNTIEKIKTLIKNSGNNFHYKVVDHLRNNNGWEVLVSPYYNDSFTDKPREIDIIAEKEYPTNGLRGNYIGSIAIRLFIECKYILKEKETVFWFDKKNNARVIEKIMSDTPFEHPKQNISINNHRYLKTYQVAKLFTSAINPSGEQKLDNDIIYKALSQSLNAMVYYRNEPSIIPREPYRNYSELLTLNYPVILCNNFDNFYKYDMVNNVDPELINSNFQLEVQYAFLNRKKENKNDYFLIDVVDFNKIDDFIKEIEESELKALQEHFRWSQRFDK